MVLFQVPETSPIFLWRKILWVQGGVQDSSEGLLSEKCKINKKPSELIYEK